jgi:AraC-like DNA-binding protein
MDPVGAPAKLELDASASAALTVSMRAVRVLFGALGRAGVSKQKLLQAAFELGFSGTVAFHRAFKRAMGTTPRAFLEGC